MQKMFVKLKSELKFLTGTEDMILLIPLETSTWQIPPVVVLLTFLAYPCPVKQSNNVTWEQEMDSTTSNDRTKVRMILSRGPIV